MRYDKKIEAIKGHKLVLTEPYEDDGQEVTIYGETFDEIIERASVEMASLRSQIVAYLYNAVWIVWGGKIVVMEETIDTNNYICMTLMSQIRESEAYNKAVAESKERYRLYQEKKKMAAIVDAKSKRQKQYEELKKEFSE